MGIGYAAEAKRAMAQGGSFNAKDRMWANPTVQCPLNCYLPKQHFANIAPSLSQPKDPMSTIANRYFASTMAIETIELKPL